MQCSYLFICVIFSDMFIYGARNYHSRRTGNEELAPENSVAAFANLIVKCLCKFAALNGIAQRNGCHVLQKVRPPAAR